MDFHPKHYHHVVPPVWIESLDIKDHLTPQRARARDLLSEAFDIYTAYGRVYSNRGSDKDKELTAGITPELAEWAIRHTDHTTLRTSRNESTELMADVARVATTPYMARSVTCHADGPGSPYGDKLTPVIKEFLAAAKRMERNPNAMAAFDKKFRITLVINYPHGAETPDEAAREVDEVGKMTRKLREIRPFRELIERGFDIVWDADTVINYDAWMKGDHKLVKAIVEAEGKAVRANDFTWKLIQKVSVHGMASLNTVFGRDAFRSVYESTMMSLELEKEIRPEYIKSCTGVGAKSPYHEFVKADTGSIHRLLPMLSAIGDFNRVNGTECGDKGSGGKSYEADVYVDRKTKIALLGEKVTEKTIFGTSPVFIPNLLEFIINKTKSDYPFDPALSLARPVDIKTLSCARRGLSSLTA